MYTQATGRHWSIKISMEIAVWLVYTAHLWPNDRLAIASVTEMEEGRENICT